MATQTAVQQLINYMEANFHLTDESRNQFGKALETEKQQIIDAVWYGHDNKPDMIMPSESFATDYFEQTFKAEK